MQQSDQTCLTLLGASHQEDVIIGASSLLASMKPLRLGKTPQFRRSTGWCEFIPRTCCTFRVGRNCKRIEENFGQEAWSRLGILSCIMGFVERMLRLFLELHAFELRERGSSSGAVVDRTSHTNIMATVARLWAHQTYIYIYLNLGWLMMTGLKRLIASWVKWSFLCGFPGCWISSDTFRFGFSKWTLADLWGWLLGVLQPDLEIISPTPWKINMEPENDGLEDDFPFQFVWILGSMLIFRGVWFNDSMLVSSLKNPSPFSRRLCCQGTSNVRGNWWCDRYTDEGWWGVHMQNETVLRGATPLQDLWLLLVIPLPIFASVIRLSWDTIGKLKNMRVHIYI